MRVIVTVPQQFSLTHVLNKVDKLGIEIIDTNFYDNSFVVELDFEFISPEGLRVCLQEHWQGVYVTLAPGEHLTLRESAIWNRDIEASYSIK